MLSGLGWPSHCAGQHIRARRLTWHGRWSGWWGAPVDLQGIRTGRASWVKLLTSNSPAILIWAPWAPFNLLPAKDQARIPASVAGVLLQRRAYR